jgi:gamma-aminobutyric acid receptor subunit beta
MDKFLFSSTVLVFMALIEVVITSHLSSTEQLVKARRIDRAAMWLFPLCFIRATRNL